MMSGIPLPQQFSQQPGGGIANAMQGLNTLTQGTAQARYAPYTAYADAASKIAYANMLPYQIQAQVLSNPYMWLALQSNPDAAKNMLNNFTKSFPQGNNIFGNVNLPPPSSSGLGGGLINSLLAKLGIGSSQNGQNPINAPSPSGSSNYPEYGASNKATPEEVTDIANNGNGQPRTPQPLPGSGMPTNPFTQVKQAEASSSAQGQANVELWKNLNDTTSNASVDSQNALNDLARLKSAYNELGTFEKGAIFGLGPHITSNAQIADQASSSLRASVLRALQQGHITNKDVATFGTIKPDRTLNPDAMNQASDFLEGASRRSQERADFNNKAANLGLTAPQANLIWTKYINDRPFYDAKNKSLNEKNLGSWRDYLQTDKMNSILSGNAESTQKTSPNTGTNNNNSNIFDPAKMLDYKYSSADEFKQAFDSLNDTNKKLVVSEMNKRGWK